MANIHEMPCMDCHCVKYAKIALHVIIVKIYIKKWYTKNKQVKSKYYYSSDLTCTNMTCYGFCEFLSFLLSRIKEILKM